MPLVLVALGVLFGEFTMTLTQTQLPPRLSAVEEPPSRSARTYGEIQADLRKPIPAKYLDTKRKQGNNLTFITWYHCCHILDHYAPGWEGRITETRFTEDRIFVTYSLTIHGADRSVTREATGTEVLKELDKEGKIREIAYGDPSSNASSMAFRRAAAAHGLGRYLYDKK